MDQNNKHSSVVDGLLVFLKIIVIIIVILICLIVGCISGMNIYDSMHPIHCPTPGNIDIDNINTDNVI